MLQWWVNFHFLRPWWLLLLIVPLLWFGKFFKSGKSQSSWEKVIDKRLLGYLLVKGSSGQRKIMAWLALLGIMSGIIAAAGPSWEKMEVPLLQAENPLMIALNLSSDMKGVDVTPNRLERAKYKIKDLLNMVSGVQTGLLVYSAEPFVVSPFSDDGQIIANLLPAINYDIMPINGDRPDRAIALATEKFISSGFQKGEILLITADAGQGFDQALQEAKKAKLKGLSINVLGVSKQDNEKLKMIAENGGGKYIKITGNDSDIKVLTSGLEKNETNLKEGKNWQSVWLDYGYYLLLLPMICCLYFFRKGILVLAFLLCAHSAQAGFWLNDNQDGLVAFNKQDFATAAAKFDDNNWKAASYYRQGDFENAYKEYAKSSDVTALYNQGNALAKGGKIEDAIAKYEEVIKAQPEHEDAKFNLEYLKKQQQNQQQNQQKNSDGKQNQQENNQQQQNQQSGNEKNEAEQEQNQQQQNQGDGENQENESEQKSNQDGSNNNTNQPQQSNEQNDNSQNQNGKSQNEPQPLGEEKSDKKEGQSDQGSAIKKGNDDEKYDEQIQARAQQYREIPEDPGGLLRAFIYKEYQRNRYNDK